MTDKAKSKARDTKKAEKAETNRISPDKPYGATTDREEDFYERQRRESPDGMTAQERDQHQKASPGSLNQTDPAGEKLGLDEDIANPPGGTQQSGGR